MGTVDLDLEVTRAAAPEEVEGGQEKAEEEAGGLTVEQHGENT